MDELPTLLTPPTPPSPEEQTAKEDKYRIDATDCDLGCDFLDLADLLSSVSACDAECVPGCDL